MLKGTVYITGDEKVIYNVDLRNTRVINLDEDGILDSKMQGVIGGTCLLPPMEAKIAEADNNEFAYDSIYSSHLLDPFQQQFISALLSYLYKGGNLIFFLPELGYNHTKEKLVYHLYKIYGIHPGIIGNPNPQIANFYIDMRCVPIWLNMIYSVKVISGKEFLYMYPEDAVINNNSVLMDLINELNPYGNTIQDKINYINHLHKVIHKNPDVIVPIHGVKIE